ncbi:MAG: methyltransferase [Candidatus Paceibacterota bacterium]
MAKWHFWGEKEFTDVYENIYVRSSVEDWFKIVDVMVAEINSQEANPKTILDVGCGEGHTTKQILDRLDGEYVCDLLEPDTNALVSAKAFLLPENTIGEVFPRALATFETEKRYDVIFTSHTNYYYALNEKDYRTQLAKLTALLAEDGKLVILTLPENSGHYRIMLRQIYPEFNYAEYITNFYKELGLKTEVKELTMRIFVGDILTTKSQFDLKIFYRFIHNTDSYPSDEEAATFLKKVESEQVGGYIDFKDHLIVISK